jgi:hypothetical protein
LLVDATSCPFCNQDGFNVTFTGVKSAAVKEREMEENRKVLEAQERMRLEEQQRDEERRKQREEESRQREQQRLAATAATASSASSDSVATLPDLTTASDSVSPSASVDASTLSDHTVQAASGLDLEDDNTDNTDNTLFSADSSFTRDASNSGMVLSANRVCARVLLLTEAVLHHYNLKDIFAGLDPNNPDDLEEIMLRQAIQLSLMEERSRTSGTALNYDGY